MMKSGVGSKPGLVAELFAGVGGFRLGLEGLPGEADRGGRWSVVWSNQWEPGTKTQDASSCYEAKFGPEGHVCEDIASYLDWAIDGQQDAIPVEYQKRVPSIDLLVGGFPCQDYSVAKPLSQSSGIAGQKGVLWWEINRFLEWKKPKYVLLENVDRLLKSPASQRGRDFAVMLSCLVRLGYQVQWRVVNAADYGFPQRRRRVFILAERVRKTKLTEADAHEALTETGTLARALPVDLQADLHRVVITNDPFEMSETFGLDRNVSPWGNAGVMRGGVAYATSLKPVHDGPKAVLGDVLVKARAVPDSYLIDPAKEPTWAYLKGAKREQRTSKSGYSYEYAEGGIAYPDKTTEPSRTILTGEGGTSASRFKHVIRTRSGQLRRLVPVELERLQGFPDDWTTTRADGTTIQDGRRAFFMGNALVVGVVRRIGDALSSDRIAGRPTF
jgi:DNA (cytosine-5)-methyltransferase 1